MAKQSRNEFVSYSPFGDFTDAAELPSVTPSAVSRRVVVLEVIVMLTGIAFKLRQFRSVVLSHFQSFSRLRLNRKCLYCANMTMLKFLME